MKYIGDDFNNDILKDIGLVKHRVFKDLGILVALYKVKKRYHVDAYKFNADSDDLFFIDGIFKSFKKNQYKVAKWYYILLIDQYERGIKIYGMPELKHGSNGL